MKIYKITEASEYLGVSINTLKTLANNGERVRQLIRLEKPEGHKADGSKYYRCFNCNGRRKLEISSRRPVFYCHKCGIGGTLDERRRYSTQDSSLKIEDMWETGVREAFPFEPIQKDGLLKKYLVKERKLSREVINRLRPHKGPSPARVYFPFYELGGTSPVYYVGRSVLPCFPRYWNPALDDFLLRKTQVLWGLHQFTRPLSQVVVCEGIFSACHEPNRVAVLGKTISQEQIDLLRSVCTEEIIICLDGDAEHSAMHMACKISTNTTLGVSILHLPFGRDPDETRDITPYMRKRERIA